MPFFFLLLKDAENCLALKGNTLVLSLERGARFGWPQSGGRDWRSWPSSRYLLKANCRGTLTHSMPGFQSSLKGANLICLLHQKHELQVLVSMPVALSGCCSPAVPQHTQGFRVRGAGRVWVAKDPLAAAQDNRAAPWWLPPSIQRRLTLGFGLWKYYLLLLGNHNTAFKRK